MKADWRKVLAAHPGVVLRLDVGPGSRLGGKLFRKEVARVGSWVHPANDEPVSFSRQDLEEIAANTNRYIAAIGGKLRGPRIHDGVWITGEQPKADDNLVWWLSFAVEGDKLYGVLEADDKVAELLGGRVQGVSLCLVPLAKDSHGNTYERVLDHVACTPEPVLDRQENFVALARPGARGIPIYKLSTHKENRMSALKDFATSLGISADLDEEKTIEELKKKFKSKEDEKASAMSAAVAAAKAEGEKNVTALATRVKTLEDEKKTRDEADLDAAIEDVKALAAKAGKPEAFSADREKRVRESWSTSRAHAQEIIALSRDLIGKPEEKTKTVLPGDRAGDAQKAQDRFDTKIALAKTAGRRVVLSKDGKKATIHPTAAERAQGAKPEEIEA